MYEWKRDSTDRASLTKLYPQLQDLKPEQLPQLPVDLAPPVYPTESLAKREKGKVELTVCLGKEGKVETIAMWKSSGSQRLDTATGRWIAKAQFSPAMKDGVAVGVCGVPVEYTWKPPG
ncbi:MAG: energy transducer TonB [Hyphomonadaceae bacterium]|nr:energy transducer TonB [Hyphomonadaceae bacterium]